MAKSAYVFLVFVFAICIYSLIKFPGQNWEDPFGAMTGSDILSKNQLLAFRIVCFIYFHTA
jgi:hypothetical protein